MPGFLDLPQEIRLQIFSDPILLTHPLSAQSRYITAVPPFWYLTAILRVNRQFRREARTIFAGNSRHPWEIYINFPPVKSKSLVSLDAPMLLPCM